MEKFSNLIGYATEKAREEKTANNRSKYTPEFARFKAHYVNRDGTTRGPYHSYDSHKIAGGMNRTDEQVGFSKLLVYANKLKVLDTIVAFTIWMNITDDLRTYIDGKLNKNYNHEVFMYVRSKKGWQHPHLTFRDGRVDLLRFHTHISQVTHDMDLIRQSAMEATLQKGARV